MSQRDRDREWAVARLTRNHQEVTARITGIFADMKLVWAPPLSVWDANNPAIVARILDSMELQMMGIKP